MSAADAPAQPYSIGPIWRDSNVRSGPSLESPVQKLLLPGDDVSYDAVGWVTGDEVVEGENPKGVIISDIWFELAMGGWCSAVNFDQETVARVVAEH
ncbi:SH3 domain-containing protein [Streptomyces sp. UNOB3_S3]|uniref:SH3 domain-containing protein n=1 Tax=Streptomyces sp. UNOB3_S3 TaxID=2871682 RepID=UPI001E5E6EF1|nr:SH3 domain-containing protein [Streptomyces sp. UNOB3_S3]MCC3775140.1 SH3 domain-containing protein [Streptomyces sp. UNOB3_S3]